MFRIAYTEPEKLDYWDSWGPALGQIESALAIIAACIPTLKPVVAAWVPSFFPNEASCGTDNTYLATTTFGGTRVTRSGHTSVVPNAFVLSNRGHTRTTIRGHSPDGSEEEIMTSNGIMRRTQVRFQILPPPKTFLGDASKGGADGFAGGGCL